MAEMTADKVKTLLESFAALCGSNSKAKDLCVEAIKFVEQQQQKIEQLKCCGNCGNWEQFDEFGSEKIHNCIANKKLTWRERFDKCDKWEVEGNG